ncbi:MAG: FtsX-like permease family protein [Actinomycetota bacterium]|nr:FtsX-like permease family protein [Actinomycetota bacterium]
MFKATLKSLLAHKLRLALTSLAIVLGVGFVAGSLVLTDTLNSTFTRLFKQIDGGVDVRVRSKATFSEVGRGGGSKYQPVPESVLATVRSVPGVKGATGEIEVQWAQMLDKKSKPIGGNGPPTLGVAVSQDPSISRLTFVTGRRPVGPDEVAIDAGTAKKYKFHVGDPIKILLRGPAREFRVAATVKVGSADNLAGATIAAFEMPTAQAVLDHPGTYDAVDVTTGGVSQNTLRDRLGAALNGQYDVVTGQDLATQEAKDVSDSFIKFIQIALLIFAGVALFVGTFIIANTFSIIVASRTRELALLRALGARRRQVMASVLGEAAITGFVSSLVGVGFGVLLAFGLRALLGAFGGKLPNAPAAIAARTVVVALVVGLAVTLVSALLPALRATKVSPMAALRDDSLSPEGGVRAVRIIVGAFLCVGALVLLAIGLGGGGATMVGLGAAAFILGVAVLAVIVVRPLARIIGAPFARLFELPGRLARENAMRNPRRTASTAAALMIGLALVTFVSVFAASIKSSLAAAFDRSFGADFVVTGKSFDGFSSDVGDRLRTLPNLDVATVFFGQWRLDGKTQDLGASELRTYAGLVKMEVTSGEVPGDDATGVMVLDTTAKTNKWKVGDTVPMEFAKTGKQDVRVAGIYKKNDFTPKYLLTKAEFLRNYNSRQAQLVVVKSTNGVSADASRAEVQRVADGFPNVDIKDQAQYKSSFTSRVNQILALVTVLLLLAIVIAAIGIINTLALSVLERTRELGLLRAIGMSRRQTRRMIRWESVIIAIIGAALGLAVGVFFGWALVQSLHDDGITNFALPLGQLVGFVLVAGAIGIIAAIFPARRAARLNVLTAIAYE